jgi:hypothetical protein
MHEDRVEDVSFVSIEFLTFLLLFLEADASHQFQFAFDSFDWSACALGNGGLAT